MRSMLNIIPIAQKSTITFRQRFEDLYYRDERIDRVYQNRLKYYGIYDSTELVGGFVLYEGGRGPLKTLITPPFFPHNGLFLLKTDIDRRYLLHALWKFAQSQYVCYVKMDLPLAFHCTDGTENWQDRWTYRLALTQSTDMLLNQVHSDIKRSHQKSISEDCTFKPATDKQKVIELIRTNLDQKNVRYKVQLLDNLHRYLLDLPHVLFFGSYKADQLIAGNILYVDQGTAYYLFGAFDRSSALNFANASHLLHTILFLQTHLPEVHTFDFEGSTIPAIEFFFKRFGGLQCKYPSMYYSRLPLFFKGPA